jgi:hypothetical protein
MYGTLSLWFVLPKIDQVSYSFDSTTSWLTYTNSQGFSMENNYWISSISIYPDSAGTYSGNFNAMGMSGDTLTGTFLHLSIPAQCIPPVKYLFGSLVRRHKLAA